MKKNIIAMAVAAAVAAPVAAMADTTMYGKIHMSYDVYTGDNDSSSDYGLSSNSSRLGIKGKEGISDNLSLIYQYEVTAQISDSRDNYGSGLFGGTRNSFVGFSGDWGTAIAGIHDTPMKGVGRKYDLFGDTVGDSRSLIAVGGAGWDLRTDNTIAYMTPDMGGFKAALAYVTDHGRAEDPGFDNDKSDNNDYDAYSISAGYSIGGFMIDGAYEQHNVNDVSGVDTDSESIMRLGAGYKMGDFKIVGLWQQSDDEGFTKGNERTVYGLGGAYSFGKSTVKAQWYRADELETNAGDQDDGADLWAVGYDYKLSKQTSVYAVYAATENDTAGEYAIAGGGHGDKFPVSRTATDSVDTGALSVGLVHKF